MLRKLSEIIICKKCLEEVLNETREFNKIILQEVLDEKEKPFADIHADVSELDLSEVDLSYADYIESTNEILKELLDACEPTGEEL